MFSRHLPQAVEGALSCNCTPTRLSAPHLRHASRQQPGQQQCCHASIPQWAPTAAAAQWSATTHVRPISGYRHNGQKQQQEHKAGPLRAAVVPDATEQQQQQQQQEQQPGEQRRMPVTVISGFLGESPARHHDCQGPCAACHSVEGTAVCVLKQLPWHRPSTC